MIHRSSILLVLLLFVLMVLPTKSYNGFYYDADEDDEEGKSNKIKKISTKKNNKKYEETDIGLGKVKMNKETGDYDGDAALSEFTLAAGSHINLRLWQFIVWQVGFVIVGMCLCGFSILIYSRCCK